jgi:hypothetical protein
LVKLGVLRRLDRLIGGLHAGSAAYVYAITGAGQRLLDLPGARRRVSEPSLPFVDHTLSIADLYVQLVGLARGKPNRELELLDLQTEPTCWRTWTPLGAGREVLRPDLYLAVAVGPDEVRWFIEVDRATEHRPALVRKAQAYQRYYESGTEHSRDGVFPRVAWLVPDKPRVKQLWQALNSDAGLNPALFAVLLADEAAAQLIA